MSEIIMRVENMTKKFPVSGGKFLTACDNITFNVRKGETVGIVGESGCGKTTLLKAIMNTADFRQDYFSRRRHHDAHGRG